LKSAECEAERPSREYGSSPPQRSPTAEHIAEESYSKLVVASIVKSTALLEKPVSWHEAMATDRAGTSWGKTSVLGKVEVEVATRLRDTSYS